MTLKSKWFLPLILFLMLANTSATLTIAVMVFSYQDQQNQTITMETLAAGLETSSEEKTDDIQFQVELKDFLVNLDSPRRQLKVRVERIRRF